MSDSPLPTWGPFLTRSIAFAAAAYAVAGGAVSIAGWLLGNQRLIDWNNSGITIKFNPALAITASGIALFLVLLRRRMKPLVVILATLVTILAVLTLIEHIAHVNIGIDTLFFEESPGALATTAPGRMGIPATISLLFIGSGLLASQFGPNSRRAAAAMALVPIALSSVSLIGYLFGADQLYSIARVSAIALQTASMIACLGLALSASIAEHGLAAVAGRDDPGGMAFRQLLVPIILVSLALGWLRVIGQTSGVYDTAFGTAIRTVLELILFVALLWWTANRVSRVHQTAAEARHLAEDTEQKLINIQRKADIEGSSLAAIVKSSSDAIVSKDLNGIIQSWNAGAQDLFGYTAAEAVGQSILLIIPPERHPEETEILSRIRGGESVNHYETVRRHKDGRPIDISLTVSPVVDSTGTIIGASKIARDITERKRVERELAEQARLLDLSNDAIIVRDEQDRIMYWNKGAEELYGFTAAEALGRVTHDLLHTEHPEALLSIQQELISGGRWSGELVHTKKDGSTVNVMSRWSLDRSDGKMGSILETNTDITEQKKAEAAIRESDTLRRLADAQEAERRRLARDLHDQLGQQLTGLRLKLESIKNESSNGSVPMSVIDEMREHTQRIDRDMSFLVWELRPTEIDSLGLDDAVASFVREWSNNYGIKADFHSAGPRHERLPPEMETNLYRIVQEALNNILKHANATDVSVLIEHRPSELVLIIEDNGSGFEPDSLEERRAGHSGLGIIGMRERTALFSGTLEIESHPGGGTTVYAKIPTGTETERGGRSAPL
ncbi:MAG: PAS domain S-box protein [Acidobacteria bacterium]|nr:PAS domain S-box protein [Acidobacteriota bacterium]